MIQSINNYKVTYRQNLGTLYTDSSSVKILLAIIGSEMLPACFRGTFWESTASIRLLDNDVEIVGHIFKNRFASGTANLYSNTSEGALTI